MIINIVIADDWQGLYIDKELVLANHTIDATDICKILQDRSDEIEYEELYCKTEWLEEIGNLPHDIDQVELANHYE